MGAYEDGTEVPIIVRGEGLPRLDPARPAGTSTVSPALFTVKVSHGRADVAQAAADQAEALGFFPIWSFAHPRAIELAAMLADLAPGRHEPDVLHHRRLRSRRVGAQARRQYHKLRGNGTKYKVIARASPTTARRWAALIATGHRQPARAVRAAAARRRHVPNTNTYRLPEGHRAEDLVEAIAHRIEFEDPSTVSAIILEPVQNAGGCFVPPEGYFARVREIADHYDVLFISDEVICSWGRLGEWFGAQRYGYQPDIITTAKGITSAYAPMGAVIASDRIFEPFAHGTTSFTHGITFGGHPVAAAVALANIAVFEEREHPRPRPGQRARVPRHARLAARHPDRRRRPGRRLLPGDRAGQGPGDQASPSTTRSPRRCCAASSRPSCSSAA